MTGLRITKRVVDSIAATGEEHFLWDADLIGFGVRVRASGSATYVIRYRAGAGRSAPTRRLTIGAVGKLTPDQARSIAKTKLAAVVGGADPVGDRAAERADMTVADLADLYLAEGVETKKASTVANDRSRINRHLKPLIGSKRVGAVTNEDVARVMRDVAGGKTAIDERTGKQGRAIVTGGKGAANQCVLLLSALFTFAIERKLRKDNPAVGIKKYRGETKERFLSTEELERLGTALREAETVGIEWAPDPAKLTKHAPRPENRRTKLDQHAAAAIRLLVLTGARLREILHLRWTDVDLQRGLLNLGDSKTGSKAVILNAPAMAILADLPRVGRFVIASSTAGTADEKPRSDLAKPWKTIGKAAGLEGVRLHDLRHTNASIGAAAGLGLPIIGKLLGHRQTSTTARYAHLDDDPVRRAADRIGSEITAAMDGGGSGGEVVPLPRRK